MTLRDRTWLVNAVIGGGGTALMIAVGLGLLAYLFWAASADARLIAVVIGGCVQNVAEKFGHP